jgi:hypothetical protein
MQCSNFCSRTAASSSGRATGISVSKQKRPTSKGLVCHQVKSFKASVQILLGQASCFFYHCRQAGKELPPLEHLMGETHIYETLLGLKFRVSPEAFFQINTSAAEVLYNSVAELACPTENTTLIDICCGTGSIGLCLAKVPFSRLTLGLMLNQLNPYSRDLIGKLIVPQLVKKFTLFYGT